MLLQLERLVLAAGGGVGKRQVAHRLERVRVLRAVHLAAERQHFLPQLQGLVPAAARVVGIRQVVHHRKRVRVFRAENLAANRHPFLAQLERLSPTAGGEIGNRKVQHGRQGVGVLHAPFLKVVIIGRFFQRDGLLDKPQMIIGISERGLQFGPSLRLGSKSAVQVRYRPIQRFRHCYGASIPAWIGASQDVHE